MPLHRRMSYRGVQQKELGRSAGAAEESMLSKGLREMWEPRARKGEEKDIGGGAVKGMTLLMGAFLPVLLIRYCAPTTPLLGKNGEEGRQDQGESRVGAL
ncbi:unnamed protein product [Closterium sp. NIES-53]